jgi:uncharacterized protein (DUF885 family)
MTGSVVDLAVEYFGYLARRFPVMCASDEFHFLPRAQAASQYYSQLEDLSIDAIDECIHVLKDFHNRLNNLTPLEDASEEFLDIELLKSNMAGVLIEFENTESWNHNPLLYLKIASIGLDHALTKPASSQQEVFERAEARLDAIPRLLGQAVENLGSIPEAFHQAALLMLTDCRKYLDELAQRVFDNRLNMENAHAALAAFGKFLQAIKPMPDEDFPRPNIGPTLRDHFASELSISEVFEIAVDEWQESLSALRRLQGQISPAKSWVELYHAYIPADVHKIDTITLYRLEAQRLQAFFREHGFSEIDSVPFPEVQETPTYMKSVRSSASFAAGFTADPREKDFFYITTVLPEQRSGESVDLLRKRLHREYKFLSAHETFPGHHLLDFTRRNLSNPIRAQIESPLFYEGWAYYVESLLTEYGYVDHPLDHLIDRKRRLWRAARCQIDTGLAGCFLSKDDALELLISAGFSREEARYQVDRFRLNPGYQLCYSVGRYELTRLRQKYGNRLGRDVFHREVMHSGELPFHLIEKRLAKVSAEAESSRPAKDL